ncbi:hypothetical protein KL936_004374 [Ogataea polymorpha]|uniref:Uncharacterized protein n=1 Tax=Ogataea polymorpha TaxID=460523 RepID=A0A9P8PN48_9ASCO|nr:hypothetical protein KL936_004374 [Ogataea polymorpha]KAG7914334.1 hypothetical protein KL927_004528 [Ogataea polymorpha]KAH3675188.1 hypothetical protein OGATHE_001527 [Ogataea polymorpha]
MHDPMPLWLPFTYIDCLIRHSKCYQVKSISSLGHLFFKLGSGAADGVYILQYAKFYHNRTQPPKRYKYGLSQLRYFSNEPTFFALSQMQFSVATLLFAATSFAASSVVLTKTEASTVSETITSCEESVTDCPARNSSSISTYEGGAAAGFGSYYAAGAAAVAAGALLL